MVLFSLSILISASYAMRTIGMLFTGPVKPLMRQIDDLKSVELAAAGILTLGIVLFGILPEPLINLSEATVSQLDSLIKLRMLQD